MLKLQGAFWNFQKLLRDSFTDEVFPKSQQLKIDQGVWQLNFFNEIEVFDSSIIFVQSVRNFSHCFTFITIMKRQKIGGLWVDHVHMAQYKPKDKLLLRYWNFDNAGTQLENDFDCCSHHLPEYGNKTQHRILLGIINPNCIHMKQEK